MSLFALLFGACGYQVKIEKKEDDTSSDVPINASDCPDEVPDEYKYVWDCTKENCDGSALVYRYTTGESSDDGALQLTQQWFVFDGVESCVDTFSINGVLTDLNPGQFDCETCELVYQIQWTMTESNCQINWGPNTFKQENDSMVYDGYLVMDTHGRAPGFADEKDPNDIDGDGNYDEPDGEIDMVRNPDGNMNVFEWPVNPETGEANKMMGTGTAISITEGTEFPETYVWTNGSGDCYQ